MSGYDEALKTLREATKTLLFHEDLIWRHQQVGVRNEESDNFMGAGTNSTLWKMVEYPVKGTLQGFDFNNNQIIYLNVEPLIGDKIVTLNSYDSQKKTYIISHIDTRRDLEGRIIYCKCICKSDHTGQ